MINDGILTVAMPGVGHMFSEKQVKELVALVAGPNTGGGEVQSTAGPVSFSEEVLPIFQARCTMCHGSSTTYGGWDGSSYQSTTDDRQ